MRANQTKQHGLMALTTLAVIMGTLAATDATAAAIAGPLQNASITIGWKTATGVVRDPSIKTTVAVNAETGDFEYTGTTTNWSTPVSGVFDQITIDYFDGNVDPVINLGVTFKDNGAPSIFSASTNAPLAPTLYGLVSYRLDLTGSFADGSPANGGTIAPVTPKLKIMNATLNGTEIAGTGLGVTFASPSDVYGNLGIYTLFGTYDCGVAGCTDFGINLDVLGPGGGDVFGFTSRFEVFPVPVPAAVWLLGSALFGLAGIARRRAV